MIVIDASIVIDALALPVSPELEAKWDALDGEEVAAPHLIDLEVLHALRRHVRRRAVAPARAQATLEALQALPLIRYPHVDLLASIWAMRHTLSAYDAAYVALAAALNAPLFTRDGRLAEATLTFTTVRLF